MSLRDFHRLEQITSRSSGTKTIVEATVVINPSHPIFDGHFPGFPVVPGVCMVQIIKTIAEQYSGRKLRLMRSSNIKFLTVLNPLETNTVSAQLQLESETPDSLEVDARLYSASSVYFKIKAAFLFTDPA